MNQVAIKVCDSEWMHDQNGGRRGLGSGALLKGNDTVFDTPPRGVTNGIRPKHGIQYVLANVECLEVELLRLKAENAEPFQKVSLVRGNSLQKLTCIIMQNERKNIFRRSEEVLDIEYVHWEVMQIASDQWPQSRS
jgi:hypothetical protein